MSQYSFESQEEADYYGERPSDTEPEELSQKESEWERKLLGLVDNKEAGYMDFSELIQETLSNREKEIAEEVEKIIQEEKKYRASTYGLSKVLSILKHQ